MRTFRWGFADRTTVKVTAVSFITAYFEARDWHMRTHYRSTNHEPCALVVTPWRSPR